MSLGVSIYVEYNIKKSDILQYESVMEKEVIPILTEFGAKGVRWFLSSKQVEGNIYVEEFYLPTVSHFYALKKLRTCLNHTVFGCFDHFVCGGIHSISYLALKRCS
jgi:hypothetical protein